MQLEKTSHWLMIIGNFGLLIGVVLVIIQINQNSELIREQLDHATWTDDLNLQLALMGENPSAAIATAIENPSTLTVEEMRVLDAYVAYWGFAILRKTLMHERGMTFRPPESFLPNDPRTLLTMRVVGNAYTKTRFEEEGMGPLTREVELLMSSITGDESLERHRRLLARIKENE
jgi:hypothetical protein